MESEISNALANSALALYLASVKTLTASSYCDRPPTQ
jgi:hypothetical protein